MSKTVETPPDSEAPPDVHARARRRLRNGSIALIAATLVPSSAGQIMWIHMGKLTLYATAFTSPRMSPAYRMNLLFLFSAFSWTIVFTGWLGLRMSRTDGGLATPQSEALLRFARRLFFGTLFPPCVFLSLYTWRFHAMPLLATLLAIPAYLLAGRWLYHRAQAQQGTAIAVLWLALLPILGSLFGWSCAAFVLLSSPSPIFAHTIALGLGGSLTMLLALRGWWPSFREAGRAETQTSGTPLGASA